MSMTATRFALQPIHVSDHDPAPAPAATVAPSNTPLPPCDFRGDGRLADALAHPRSAWACPLFYLAIPASAVLALAAGAIRLCDRAATVLNRSVS